MSVRTIETMLDWVEDNIEEGPTLDKMANYVGYSEFYCSAKFHECVGVSFKEYLLKRKLNLAAQMLINSDAHIIEIAMKYGFSSHEAFTRAFKRAYGCAPNHYRLVKPEIPIFERAHVL